MASGHQDRGVPDGRQEEDQRLEETPAGQRSNPLVQGVAHGSCPESLRARGDRLLGPASRPAWSQSGSLSLPFVSPAFVSFSSLSISLKLNGIQLPAPCVFSRSRLSPFHSEQKYVLIIQFNSAYLEWIKCCNDKQY